MEGQELPEEIVESFQVKRLTVLDEKGNSNGSLTPSLTDEELKRMYELLVLARTFDQRALSLQREGRLGTYPSWDRRHRSWKRSGCGKRGLAVSDLQGKRCLYRPGLSDAPAFSVLGRR